MKFLKGADGQGFCHTVGLREPTDTGNANLIAAAPDLLEACKEMEQIGDHMDLFQGLPMDQIFRKAFKNLRSAIKSAEAKQ